MIDKETGSRICLDCYREKFGDPQPETTYFQEYKKKHPEKFKEYYRRYYRKKRNIPPERYRI